MSFRGVSVDFRCPEKVQKHLTRRIFAWIAQYKKRIETLNVSGMLYVNSVDVHNLDGISVKHLIMQRMKFRYVGLEEFLSHFYQLKTLDLSQSCFLRNIQWDNFVRLESLRELNVHGCNLSDTQFSKFGSLPLLNKLDLSNNRITDLGLAFLCSWTNLVTLDVSQNHVSNRGLAALQGLQRLQDVEAFCTDICEPLSFHFRVWILGSHGSLLMRLFSNVSC